MQDANQDLNEKNLQELNDEVSNYLTDSDIEDPKYLPTIPKQNNDHIPHLHSHPHSAQMQFTQENLVYPLQEQIKSLKYDTDLKNKSLKDLESENTSLKTELFKLQESIKAKDIVISEFQNLLSLTKSKFSLFEEKNKNLLIDNERLIKQIEQYDRELKGCKAQIDSSASNSKSIKVYEEHIAELQLDFNQREAKLNKRYQDKETALKAEYLSEIAKIAKELDDIKIEREKSIYEISNYKIKVEELQSQLEDKEYEFTAEIAKKTKENKKQCDVIRDLNEKISQMESEYKLKSNSIENTTQTLKEAKAGLIEDLASKDDHIRRLEDKLAECKHDIEMMTSELKESNSKFDNKDIIIDQMRNQNDQLYKELSIRENELVHNEDLKQKELSDYNDQLNAMSREKNDLEAQNAELIDNLAQANEQLKKLSDLINDKYSALEMSLYKQTSKNEQLEKKYKGMIKQMKHNQKSLYEDNRNLKEQINQRDYEKDQMEYQYQNDIKNLSFYNSQNYGSVINNNNNVNNTNPNIIGSPLFYNQTNPNVLNNSMSIYDVKEEGQKKTLEEFKRLLSKIDEKLDLPIKNMQ